jgi:hypothetical protein
MTENVCQLPRSFRAVKQVKTWIFKSHGFLVRLISKEAWVFSLLIERDKETSALKIHLMRHA